MEISSFDDLGYAVAVPDDGMVLTYYHDDEDISNYCGLKKIYAKSESNFDVIREITIEQHIAYSKQKEEAQSQG